MTSRARRELHSANNEICRLCSCKPEFRTDETFLKIVGSTVESVPLDLFVRALFGVQVSSGDGRPQFLCGFCNRIILTWITAKANAMLDQDRFFDYVRRKFNLLDSKRESTLRAVVHVLLKTVLSQQLQSSHSDLQAQNFRVSNKRSHREIDDDDDDDDFTVSIECVLTPSLYLRFPCVGDSNGAHGRRTDNDDDDGSLLRFILSNPPAKSPYCDTSGEHYRRIINLSQSFRKPAQVVDTTAAVVPPEDGGKSE